MCRGISRWKKGEPGAPLAKSEKNLREKPIGLCDTWGFLKGWGEEKKGRIDGVRL